MFHMLPEENGYLFSSCSLPLFLPIFGRILNSFIDCELICGRGTVNINLLLGSLSYDQIEFSNLNTKS